MNSRERVLTSLEHREPDLVPTTELDVDPSIMEDLTGGTFAGAASLQTQVSGDRRTEVVRREMQIACARKYFDLICVDLSAPDGFEAKSNPDGTRVDELGRIITYDELSKLWSPMGSRSIFRTPEDVEDFTFPDPHAPGRTFGVEYVKKRIGDEMALATFIRDPFSHAWEVFSPVAFVRWMFERPKTIELMFDKTTSFNMELIKRAAEIGADLIISGGDYAEAKGLIFPLKFFREMVLPRLKQQVDQAHRVGLKFVKHSDGNLNLLVEDLSRIVDGMHSIDPSAGMSLGEVKQRYGERLVLMGNVSVDNLAKRSREEIVEETKRCIRDAAPGGGYVLSSSNSWYVDCKPENLMAMIETTRKYGRYPIQVWSL